MEPISSDLLWTIVTVVLAALGIHVAAKADRRKQLDQRDERLDRRINGLEQKLDRRIGGLKDELGSRIDGLEQKLDRRIGGLKDELGSRIDGLEQKLGRRIDRLEDRVDENHREVSAALADTKAAVSALSARLDERSSPRRLLARSPGASAGVASDVSVREQPGDYSGDEPQGKPPEDEQRHMEKRPSGQA